MIVNPSRHARVLAPYDELTEREHTWWALLTEDRLLRVQ